MRRSWLSTVLGVTALLAFAAMVAGSARLIPLDASVWYVVLHERGCATDRVVERMVVAAGIAMTALFVAALVLHVGRSRWRAGWPPLALIGIGLLASKVLKNVIVRERPSMLPGVALGHSFPSGHVMNTAVVALIVVLLVRESRRLPWWTAAAATCVIATAAGRVLLSHHWLSDTLGAILAATAVVGLAWTQVHRRPLLAPATVVAVLAAMLLVVTHARDLAIGMPSPLVGRSAERASEPRIWTEGDVTVPIELATPGDGAAYVVFAGRPDIDVRCCVSMRVTVNDRPLRPFIAFVGWREYRLRLPRGTLRAGHNQVTLAVRDGHGDPWRFALAYVDVRVGLAGERWVRSAPFRTPLLPSARRREPDEKLPDDCEPLRDLTGGVVHRGPLCLAERARGVGGVGAADAEDREAAGGGLRDELAGADRRSDDAAVARIEDLQIHAD
jgi:undecaprenyl-diphosphatase